MGDIEIGLVSNLEVEDSIAENLLTSPDDIQTPISGIIEWKTLRTPKARPGNRETLHGVE